MSETFQLQLPLVQAGQAQKHVTVNESLARLDALTHKQVQSRTVAVPPTDAVDGQAYLVPSGSSGVWSAQDGSLAIFTNGGWVFAIPTEGWRLWLADEGLEVQLIGSQWRERALPELASGASLRLRTLEFDHSIVAGSSNFTATLIPKHACVIGVTGRVITAVSAGAATSWSLGVPGFPDRYGTQYGLAVNSYVVGMTGQPQTYWEDTALELTAEGDDFVSGQIKLAVHFLEITPPDEI